MRKILVYLVVFFSGLISAQEAHILFNRMNMAVYNPAFTGTNGVTMTGRGFIKERVLYYLQVLITIALI